MADSKAPTLPAKKDEVDIDEHLNQHVVTALPDNYGKLGAWDARSSHSTWTARR
jgi:hypothetical protein